MRIVFLSIVTLFILVGCSSLKKTKIDMSVEEFIKAVVVEQFNGDSVNTIYNNDRDFAIVVNKIERGVGYPTVINFVIVDLLEKKILYSETVSDGAVSWINNNTVLIKRVPGAMSKDEEENEKAKRTEINVREL